MERKAVARARETGSEAVGALRRHLAQRTAQMIRSDPDAAEAALEMGLIDARWLEDPNGYPNVTSPATEVLERFLQRTVDARPSRLGALGLGAVQLLTSLAGSREATSVETVAVVFTDLEGFTPFTDRYGDRVTESADGGQVLVTAELAEAAGPIPAAVYGPGRSRRLKGIADRVTLHEVRPRP